jgi:Cytochrome c oxidase assembly protein CtaG/Cox11
LGIAGIAAPNRSVRCWRSRELGDLMKIIVLMLNRKFLLFTVAAVLLIVAAISFETGGLHRPNNDPFTVVQSYLKASYARDYQNAYQYISSQDQRVWNETSYASQYGNFTGFALELAQTVAESMEVWVIEKQLSSDRAHYKIGYRVPTADELSSLLFDWDPDKLNALSRPRQERLLETLGKMKKDGKMIMIEGQEAFELVSDKGSWKVFLDWASGIKVTLKADSAPSTEVEARFVQSELIVKKDEPFQIDLKIKNRSKRPIVARIVHHVEPRDMENHIDMIACGALRPLALQPGDVQEISSAYLIKDGLATGTKIGITYEFKLEPLPAKGVYSRTNVPKRNSTNTT